MAHRICRQGLIAAALVTAAVGANSASLLVNGSFELNSAGATVFNPSNASFNSLMSGVTAFGVREGIDIQTIGSGFGLAPQDGLWKISPASDMGGTSEAVSLAMHTPLVAGQSYSLDFYIERLISGPFDGGSVEVGVSGSAFSFGTTVATASAPASGWLHFSDTFVAPTDAMYLTVLVTNGQSSWVGLDNFTLAAVVPEPGTAVLLAAGLGLFGLRTFRNRSK